MALPKFTFTQNHDYSSYTEKGTVSNKVPICAITVVNQLFRVTVLAPSSICFSITVTYLCLCSFMYCICVFLATDMHAYACCFSYGCADINKTK